METVDEQGRWYGYDVGDRRDPHRPWWERLRGPTSHTTMTTRTDGWRMWASGAIMEPGEQVRITLIPPQGQADERLRAWVTEETWEAEARRLIEQVDREHPLPVPPPLCNQVWVCVRTGVHLSISRINVVGQGLVVVDSMVGLLLVPMPTWPPQDHVLVHGPRSPWAPMGGESGDDS